MNPIMNLIQHSPSGYLSVNGEYMQLNLTPISCQFWIIDSVTADGLSIQLQFSEGLTVADDSAGSVRSQFTIEADGV